MFHAHSGGRADHKLKMQYIHKCENYFSKSNAQICVFRIFFVPLQPIYENNVYIMNERERIEQVMKSMNLSARQFAAEIRVQPGTISNMMAGRNNPSLEVMRRIMERYTTLNPEWLILGVGEMWRTEPGKEPGLFDRMAPDPKNKTVRTAQKEEPQVIAAPSKQIKNIVVYYTDGTYEEYIHS